MIQSRVLRYAGNIQEYTPRELRSSDQALRGDFYCKSHQSCSGIAKSPAKTSRPSKALQDDNTASLEKMRQTVDEKLHETLDKRLGESFRRVSDQLESVYKGLGEMQSLAVGVGDLKRVLTNVRARGTWGEVQLDRMLEQVFCPDQYEKNVATKEGGEFVEFAIKLPGRGDDKDEIVWLPIDSKFPIEDYQRLQDAQEKGDAELAEATGKQLRFGSRDVRGTSAKSI